MARPAKYSEPVVRLGAYVPVSTKDALTSLIEGVNSKRERKLSVSECLVVLIDVACAEGKSPRGDLEAALLVLP